MDQDNIAIDLMSPNVLAIAIALLSVFLSLASLFFSRLKPGRLKTPPIRAYRVEPLNFHSGGELFRRMRLFLPLTFVNTGAHQTAISDLRVRIQTKGGPVYLGWELELPSLDGDPQHVGRFAGQPSLPGYESSSHVYTFLSMAVPEAGRLVKAIEDDNGQSAYEAILEQRKDATKSWSPMQKFRFHYDGRNRFEADFGKIHG